MEIKIEIESPLLCYGCLSSDRRLTKANDELSRLFYLIRSDGNNASISNTLQLCWECLAVLKRISRFQQQVIAAQFELFQCMPYNLNDENTIPTSLSSLQYTHTNQETFTFKYEETVFKTNKEHNNLLDSIKNKLSNIEISMTPLLPDNIKKEENNSEDINIKDESENENIKDEFDDDFNGNDSDSDVEEEIPKQKNDKEKKKSLWKNYGYSLKYYKKYATVIKRKQEFKSAFKEKNIQKYSEIVQISESDYEKNMLESDTRYKLLKEGKRIKKAICHICRLTFKRFYDLVKHKAFEHDKTPFPRKCTTCETLTQSKAEFMSHWSLCQSVGYKCLLCPDIYRDTTDMEIHLTTVHAKVVKCNKCKFEALSESSSDDDDIHVEYVMMRRPKIMRLCSRPLYTWDEEAFFQRYRLRKQTVLWLLNDIGSYLQVTTTSSESSSDDDDIHVEYVMMRRPKIMRLCSRPLYTWDEEAFFQRYRLRKQTVLWLLKDIGSYLQVTTTRFMMEFYDHYKSVHQKVICDYCKKPLLSKKRLIRHITLYHTPDFCEKCNRTYKSKYQYDRHCALYHAKEETSKELSYCVECDRQFPSVVRFKYHLMASARHNRREIKKIPCPDCGKTYSKSTYMKNHYSLVHLKATKHYCSECDKYFGKGYALRQHEQNVHQKAPKPKDKICDICGRGFSTNNILVNHRRTHTGERPFKCSYCSASFAQQTAMNTHQKTQHKNVILENK